MKKEKLNLEDELLNFALFNKLNYRTVINKNISLDNRILLIYAMKNKINISLLENDVFLSKYSNDQLLKIIKLLFENKNPILLQNQKLKDEDLQTRYDFTMNFYQKNILINKETKTKYSSIIDEEIPSFYKSNDYEID
ncbi:hypothetical protein [Spiroplasma endosymbiont of Labia minor]|uniref:hypothetical protein n=1 Tax=Spiroplasma endosymbiont of Labia minor TaxID=3066305 RepID=UPI0030CBE2FF